MSINKKIRNALGLNAEQTAENKARVESWEELEEAERFSGVAEQATQGVAATGVAPTPEEAQIKACADLKAFEITHGTRTLLERAMDNIAKNNGANLEDEGAKAKANAFATITVASGYDLSIALAVIAESEVSTRLAGTIYSYCYSVLKAATFISNLDYRRELDPNGELDATLYADKREENRTPPLGLQADMPEVPISELVTQALGDLQLFLTLVAESYGWQPRDIDNEPNARMIPFDVVMTTDGKFESIYGLEQAMDRQEVKRKVAMAKRKDAFAAMSVNAAKRASELVRAAVAKRQPTTRN